MHHTEGETDDIYVMITRRKMPQLYIGHPKSGRGPHSSFKVLEQMLLCGSRICVWSFNLIKDPDGTNPLLHSFKVYFI